MVKLNKVVFLLQSVCCHSCFYSFKSSSMYFKQLRMNASIAGKGMLLRFQPWSDLATTQTLMFCEIQTQSACTMILPCPATFITLLARQCLRQLVSAGRITSCTPGACGRITTFLSSLCRCFFDPALLPHNVV